ncbi:MAG: HAD hydrolase-like protein [Alphaproteobacteria bacterium]
METLTPQPALTHRPQAVLFDWDMTLADGWAVIVESMNATLNSFGREAMTSKEMRFHIRRSLRDSFPGLFGEEWQKARKIYYQHFNRLHLDHIAPLDGAQELLDGMRDMQIPIGMISNKGGKSLREEVELLGWTDRFGVILGAGDCKADKPDPAPVLRACEVMGLTCCPSIIYAGDMDVDMELAARCGLTGALIGGADHPLHERAVELSSITLANPLALLEYVANLPPR